MTVDCLAWIVDALGQASQMAKVDIESAYRLIPVYPDDQVLLAVQWNGETLPDTRLPFGLHLAPKLFNTVADGLEWCICQNGVSHVYYYLDDFIVLGPPHSNQCTKDLGVLLDTCTTLSVPLAEHKEGPTCHLTFLGIKIDSVAQTLRLPNSKLERLVGTLTDWGG